MSVQLIVDFAGTVKPLRIDPLTVKFAELIVRVRAMLKIHAEIPVTHFVVEYYKDASFAIENDDDVDNVCWTSGLKLVVNGRLPGSVAVPAAAPTDAEGLLRELADRLTGRPRHEDIIERNPRLIHSVVKILTWNVWGRCGQWRVRAHALMSVIKEKRPDIICMQEVWDDGLHNQAALFARELGFYYYMYGRVPESEGHITGVAILSRWPMSRTNRLILPRFAESRDEHAVAIFARVEGPRGPIPVFTTHLDWQFDRSSVRVRQVGALCNFVDLVMRDEKGTFVERMGGPPSEAEDGEETVEDDSTVPDGVHPDEGEAGGQEEEEEGKAEGDETETAGAETGEGEASTAPAPAEEAIDKHDVESEDKPNAPARGAASKKRKRKRGPLRFIGAGAGPVVIKRERETTDAAVSAGDICLDGPPVDVAAEPLHVDTGEAAGPALPMRTEGTQTVTVAPDGGSVTTVQTSESLPVGKRFPPILTGDFNAEPMSEEMRMLTGLCPVPVPGLHFLDAWQMAGHGPGLTWDNANEHARRVLEPSRRLDYILVGEDGSHGCGHVVKCEMAGTRHVDGVLASDHYAVYAELRY